MQSQENFQLIFSQISKTFSSFATKTMSLEFINSKKYMTQEQFLMNLKQISHEIPFLKIILAYDELFTLIPLHNFIISQQTFKVGLNKYQKIGTGGHAQVFIAIDYLQENKKVAMKIMDDVNEYRQESYLQECINQYKLQTINLSLILNIEHKVFINFLNNKATFQLPLELAEFSLFDFIQENEITQETLQYFFNLFIDLLILLHENNFAYRDIKPQNILFVMNQGWKLADFGESLQYQQRTGVYKIQGTIAFMPRDVRLWVYKNKEIVQDLFYNDVYAVVSTLILIKNPLFKSYELIEFIQIGKMDEQCLQLLQVTHPEQLKALKFYTQGLNMKQFDMNKCEEIKYNLVYNLKVLFYNGLSIHSKLLDFIDQELLKLKNNDMFEYKKLIAFLLVLHPFQVEQLKQINYQYKIEIYEVLLQEIQDKNHSDILVLQIIQTQHFEFLSYLIQTLIVQQDQQKIKCLLNIIIQLKNQDFDLNEVKTLLDLIGVKQIQINNMIQDNENQIDSATMFFYNQCYFQIHGYDPQGYQNYLIEEEPIKQNFHYQDKSDEFDYDGYVNQTKNDLPHNLILLFHPLNNYLLNQETYDKVMIHIIQQLRFTQGDKTLSELIKFHLIMGGTQQYLPKLNLVIRGVIKLFMYYDLFYDLINLLEYFYGFMEVTGSQFRLLLLYQTNRIKVKLNIQYSINNFKHVIYSNLLQRHNKNCFLLIPDIAYCFNLSIQYSQMCEIHKTKNQFEDPIKLGISFFNLLSRAITNQVQMFYKNKTIILAIINIVETLDDQRFQEQSYLRILILMLVKYLQAEIFDYNFVSSKFNTGLIRLSYDHILFHFYFQCKQHKRITSLIKQWQQGIQKIFISNKQMEQIFHIKLMKQNLKINLEKSEIVKLILNFTFDQKQRYYFHFQQHLLAFKVFPSLKKRINIDKFNLREQYMSLI